MFIYIFSFFLSTFFVYVSGKISNKTLSHISGIIAILILSILAGQRDFSVGTDVMVYVVPDFFKAQLHTGNFLQFYTDENNGMEFMYMIVQYFGATFFKTPHITLFVLSFITNSFVYLGINNQLDIESKEIGWLAYCFLFYNLTLNMMRQSVSMAIIFYAFSNFKRITFKKTIIFIVLATLFHSSGVIGILIYILFALSKVKNSYIRNIITMLTLIVPFVLTNILEFMIGYGVISDKYTLYFTFGTDMKMDWQNILIRAIGFSSYFIYIKLRPEIRENERMYINIALLDIIFPMNNSYLTWRSSTYLSFFEIKLFATGMKLFSNKNTSRILMQILLVFCMFLYWYYRYIILGYHDTYPYKFGL
ncbi:EpsG family protein [Latilactobacillus sakei]|uniref:EpsG family protein n=1 Tax=Latilactobacillus sakei TaxID=1599 RepID=A0AAE8J4H4_LATSK|nr:EpsG family protein [Latilactobacillus sakei]SPE20438.1 hypothetical protein LAS9267_00824 [Latilactobacillus sakei]